MRNGSSKRFRYDRTTIALHWMTALLVAEQWLGAQTIDWFPRGGPRVYARSVHISAGLLLGIVLLICIAWRAGRGRGYVSARASDGRLLSLQGKAGLSCRPQYAEHGCRASKVAKSAASGGNMLVVARAGSQKVAQLVVALTEPGG